MVLVGSEVKQIPCLCNHIDFFCHLEYFIHLGLGSFVSIFFLFCFILCLACDCACGFVQYINRDWATHAALLGGFYVGLTRGLICGVLQFFYSRIYELSEFMRMQYIFEFASHVTRAVKAKRLGDGCSESRLARRGLGARSYPYLSTLGEKPAQGKERR